MASNAKALSFLSGDLSLSGSEVSINVAGSVQSDSITGSTITMKNTGSTIVASDGTTAVLSESSGTVTIDADVSTIGSATISGGSITGTEIDLKSSGTTIFASDGTTAVLSESGGVVTLTADEANVGSNALVVDSSGNVGIGTSSPSAKLSVFKDIDSVTVPTAKSDYSIAIDVNGDVSGSYVGGIAFGDSAVSTAQAAILAVDTGLSAATALAFATGSTGGIAEHMRIDSSGNVLVGATTPALASTSTVEGIALNSDATTQMSRAGVVQYLNRISTDGTILDLRKDGTTVGGIGTIASKLTIGSANTGVRFNYASLDTIVPWNVSTNAVTNGATSLGYTNALFDDIYASNDQIQTSDRNEKQDIEELSEAEQRVAIVCKGLLRKFRWKSAVAKKGDEARIHFGIIAQDLQAAFESEGLDAGRYAMFISSTWWETFETYTDDEGIEQTRTITYNTAEEAPEGAVERTRLGVRYSELLSFIIAAL